MENNVNISNTQKAFCHLVIHGASTAAAGIGGGLAQIPVADHAGLCLIQSGMISGLAKVFNVSLTQAVDNIIDSCLAATVAGQGITKMAIGWMPGAGNVICGATAAVITETLGWAVANEYSRVRHTHEELDINRVIKLFNMDFPKIQKMMK